MAKQKNTSKDWRFLAERDLRVAIHLAENMHPTPTEHVAFQCQQAAEKFLKGVLVICGEEPPYIHNLIELCKLAEKHKPAFSTLMNLCSTVNYFSVQPRYDRGLSLSEEDMRVALNHTKRIKDFLQSEIPELFQDEAENPETA